MNGCVRVAGYAPANVTETVNIWAVGECARAVSEVTSALDAFRFNDAAGAAYRFVWNVFCDWYLELAKPILQGADGAAKDETRATTAHLLDEICKILHPFMPFLTEELWAIKGAEGPARSSVLALARWPQASAVEDAQAELEIGWLVELVSEIRSARAETNVPAGSQVSLVLVKPGAETAARAARWDETLRRLARLGDVSIADAVPPGSVQLVVRGEVVAMPLAGVVDLAAEQQRLAKEAAKLTSEIGKIDAKLGNADFLARAPEEVVDEQRERRDEAEARLVKIRDAAERLARAAG